MCNDYYFGKMTTHEDDPMHPLEYALYEVEGQPRTHSDSARFVRYMLEGACPDWAGAHEEAFAEQLKDICEFLATRHCGEFYVNRSAVVLMRDVLGFETGLKEWQVAAIKQRYMYGSPEDANALAALYFEIDTHEPCECEQLREQLLQVQVDYRKVVSFLSEKDLKRYMESKED